MKTQVVRVWKTQVNALAGNKKSYTVLWKVGGERQSKTFAKSTPADRFRSALIHAQNSGEEFDTETGLPESMNVQPEQDPTPVTTWLAFAQEYVTMKWPGAAAKSRNSMVEALATVTPVLVSDDGGRPNLDLIRRALRDHLLPPSARQHEVPDELVPVVEWLRDSSLPLTELLRPTTVRAGLDALALKMDGTATAAVTTRRKRSVFYNVLQYAVELERLDYNPIDKVTSRRKKVVSEVDRRVVVNPRQADELLTCVTYVGVRGRGPRLRAFFAAMYYGALRPGEALGLRQNDCHLPVTCLDCGADLSSGRGFAACRHERREADWGLLVLERSRPMAGKRWTDSGEAHDDRGLKHRGDTESRGVPIPPELVLILWDHLDEYGTASDGRLFQSPSGGVVGASTYSRVWEAARQLAFTPRQVTSPLAGRPYDLRHAAVSLWLNAGVHAPDVAERAGQSVEVLLSIYAKCLDGQRDVMNQRISLALAA